MNENFGIISFSVMLAVNLLLFGALAALGVTAAFRLAKNVPARARYLIAVAVFLIAVFAPFFVTLQAAFKSEPVSKPISTIDFREESGATLKSSSLAGSIVEISLAGSAALDGFVPLTSNGRLGRGFFALWLSVAVALLFREFTGHLSLMRMRKRLRPADFSLRKELNCADDIRLYTSEAESPATIGLLRPVVILPGRFPTEISGPMACLILRHEMSHARWRDPLVNALLRIIQAVFWISPALWFIGRVVRDEQEAAADSDALVNLPNQTNADSVADYACLLLTIAKFSGPLSPSKQSSAIMRFGGSSQLEDRVRRLLAGHAKTGFARLSLAISFLLMSFSGMAFLPAVSLPNRVNEQSLAGNMLNKDLPANNSVEKNPTAEFVNLNDTNRKNDPNRFRITVNKTEENNNPISAQPASPLNSDEKSKTADSENNKKQSNDEAIPPVQAQDAVKANPVINPITPQKISEVQQLQQLPQIPNLPQLPQPSKLQQFKSVFEPKPR